MMYEQKPKEMAAFIEQMEREQLVTASEELAKDSAQLERCADLIGELSWKTTNADAVIVAAEIKLLSAKNDPQRSLNDIFKRIATHAGASYSDDPSDADILTHVATPDLVRWALVGFRRYASKTDAKPQDMPTAFGLRRGRRGPRDGLHVHAGKLIEVGKAAYLSARKRSGSGEAMNEAVEAALQAYIPLRMTNDELTKPEGHALRKQLRQMIDSAIPTWR